MSTERPTEGPFADQLRKALGQIHGKHLDAGEVVIRDIEGNVLGTVTAKSDSLTVSESGQSKAYTFPFNGSEFQLHKTGELTSGILQVIIRAF